VDISTNGVEMMMGMSLAQAQHQQYKIILFIKNNKNLTKFKTNNIYICKCTSKYILK
jgi:hypothetical protein